MTICFSLSNLELGGAQVFVVRLANYLAEKNKKPVYIYDHWPEHREPNTIHQLHPLVKIISYSENPAERWFIWKLNALIHLFDPSKQFRYHLNKKRLLQQISRYGINIINSHMSYSDFVLSELELPPGCRLVLTLHGEYEMLLKEASSRSDKPSKIRNAVGKAAAIIYTADKNIEAVSSLENISAPASKKINIGFDPSAFKHKHISRQQYGYSSTDFIVGMVSRGLPEKGWDTAIRAVQLHNAGALKKVHLLCIGNGHYLRELVQQTNDPAVRLLQFEENFQDYFYCYPLFDLFIFPSRFEGESVPNVVIESLYWNVPVLASRHAEIPAMLDCGTDQSAGICVDPGAAAAELFTHELTQLVKDEERLRQLRKNCSSAFRKFNMEKVARECEEVFWSVIKK